MKIRATITALAAAVALTAAPAAAQQNIVQVASGNDNFETLVQAVTAANLAGALSGAGPSPSLRRRTRRSTSSPPGR